MGILRISTNSRRSEAIAGYIAISPWLIGFVLFTVGPIVATFVISLTRWEALTPPTWVGLDNYRDLVTDKRFIKSITVSIQYTVLFLPLSLILGLGLAILLNTKVRGVGIFRTIFYIPFVLAGVSVSILWLWIFNPQLGLLNYVLGLIGIDGPAWLRDPSTALSALVIMGLWGVGAGAIIFLAGLQNIPPHLYEAAEIDGAGAWQRFRRITLPLLSPTIFFLVVIGIIESFQAFTNVAILTRGGPEDSTLMYQYFLYDTGFKSFKFGYASAVGWVGTVIIVVLAALIFRTQDRWVYYESDRKLR